MWSLGFAWFGGGGFGRLLIALQTGVASRGELVLELLDPSGRVDVLQLARVEGVASAANIDFELGHRATRGERVAATALNGGLKVLGVDALFHSLAPAAGVGGPCLLLTVL